MIVSSAGKSPALPYAGRAQTSSSVKSGAISRIRQGQDSCTAFGSLMADPLGAGPPMPAPDPYGIVWIVGTAA